YTVLHLAKESDRLIICVAPTLCKSKLIVPPHNTIVVIAEIKPPSIWISAPSSSKPLICCSIGLEPMAQPPGKATLACPKRANNGPITRILALILLTYSYGASSFNCLVASTVTISLSLSYETSAFNVEITLLIVSTSLSAGTFCNSLTPSDANSDAVHTGNTAFLAPETLTSPINFLPPLISILSILNPPLNYL